MLNKFKSNPNNQYLNKEYIMATTTETSEDQLMKFNAKKSNYMIKWILYPNL